MPQIRVIDTHNILTVNRSPEHQSLLDYKLLRHSLPNFATISVVHHSTCHNQKASNEATDNATCYCPCMLFGRRLRRKCRLKSGRNVRELERTYRQVGRCRCRGADNGRCKCAISKTKAFCSFGHDDIESLTIEQLVED